MLDEQGLQLLTVFLGLAGLTVSLYLHHKKKSSKDMMCPMNGKCEEVVTSKYSKFLGFDVEVLGILYYTTIIVAYTVFYLTPNAAPTGFSFAVLMSSIAAAMFSAYLTFCQAFNLEKWCTWCLASAAFTLGILITSASSSTGLTSLMIEYQAFLTWLSVIGAAIGLGTSIAFDALYLTYLKDFEISDAQAESLNTLTHLVWASIAIASLGLIGLYIGNPLILKNPAFASSVFVLATLFLVESVYSLYLANNMADITFADIDENNYTGEKENSFFLASVSTISWTVLLSLQIIQPHVELYNILAFYMMLVAVLGFSGLFLTALISRKAEGTLPSWSPLH